MGELLGAAAWAGKIYSGGWVDGGGQTFASVEPATGRQLGLRASIPTPCQDNTASLGNELIAVRPVSRGAELPSSDT